MKLIIWLLLCLAFAYGIAKYYPVEYVTVIDAGLHKIETLIDNSDLLPADS